MSETPVDRLKISHPTLRESVSVDIPWTLFPESMRRRLDLLDADDNGEIAYTPVYGQTRDQYVEVTHADGSAGDLSRLLWRFAGDAPHNNRDQDRATLPDRSRAVQGIHDRLYTTVVLPIVQNGSGGQARWEEARRVLELTGDFVHLYRLSQIAHGEWVRTNDARYLEVEEGLLFSAERLAAGTASGRSGSLDPISDALRSVGTLLDRRDAQRFREETTSPVFLAASGSPVTADLGNLNRGELVWVGVAVPGPFRRENEGYVEAAIQIFFAEEGKVFIQGSPFRDRLDSARYQLVPEAVELDRPETADDRLGSPFSFHLQQDRLDRTVFRGREMAYYRVGFRLPQAAEALGGREIRKFDLLLERNGRVRKRIDGGFVLQDKTGRASRDVFASDLHVSRRDYEIVRVMAESLRHEGGESSDLASEVERFYESLNEQVEAAIDIWTAWYREGRIDRVFITGDLADFINIASTMERQGYHGTNVRYLKGILSRFEGPLYVASGNHDHHGFPFPFTYQARNFSGAGHLRDLYGEHYDDLRISGGDSVYNGMRSLLPTSCSNPLSCFLNSFMEANAEDPYRPNDDFMAPLLGELGIYESYRVELGNRTGLFVWPTESEDFNYVRYLETGAHPPLRREIMRAARTYYDNRHANGKGPRPEIFLAFLRELEAAKARGGRLILAGHFPPFYAGMGPDRIADSEDALRGEVALAVRLASWYYRNDTTGEPVLAVSLAGHVHRWTETDFSLGFLPYEETRFRAELGRIFAEKDPATIYERIHDLRHDWDLDDRITIRRVFEPGAGGFPGPLVGGFNRDSDTYGRSNGTIFVTLPAAGPSSEAGFGIVTSRPDGRIEFEVDYLRLRTDGELMVYNGPELERLRRERWEEAANWDRGREMDPFVARPQLDEPEIQSPESHSYPNPDWFPLMCQYTRGNFCVDADVGAGWDLGKREPGVSLGGQLVFSRTLFVPSSNRLNTFLGSPNDFRVGGDYNVLTGWTRFRMGVDIGIPQLFLFGETNFHQGPLLGVEARLMPVLPILPVPGVKFLPLPGLVLWAGSDLDGNPAAGFGLRFDTTLMAVRRHGLRSERSPPP